MKNTGIKPNHKRRGGGVAILPLRPGSDGFAKA